GQTPDASAPRGLKGTWLLDPGNVTIQNGPGTLDTMTPNFTATTEGSTLDYHQINQALDMNENVVITADGYIRQNADAPITKQTLLFASLTMNAGNYIELNGGITPAGPLSLTLKAGGNITVNGPITATGLASLTAGGDIHISGSLNGMRDVDGLYVGD